MPKKSIGQPKGKLLANWTFPEYTQYQRGRKWYFGAGIIMALLLLYSLFTFNFLFAVIIILFSIILYAQHKKPPLDVSFMLYEDGIKVSSRFYKFKEIESFWIIYEPPQVKNLYLNFKAKFRPVLTIPLEKQNPVKIRRFFLEHIDEDLDKEEETFAEILGRRLKI